MPTIPLGRGVLAMLLCLLVAIPITVMSAASPASAADGCCLVSITNMPGQFPVGGQQQPFTLHVVNRTDANLRYLNVTFLIQANGLVGDLVHLQRLRADGGPHSVGTFTQRGVHEGAVTAHDQVDLGKQGLRPGGAANIPYQLAFSKKVPGGALSLSVQVEMRRDRSGVSSAGPYQSTILAAGQQIQASPTPTPTPTAVATPTPSNALAGPTDQQPLAGSGSSGGGGSLTWLAYTLGALLLLGGIALIGTLAWRRGPRGVDVDDDGSQPYGQPAYPPQPYGGSPTAVVDYGAQPWAAGDTAPTRIAPSHAAPTRVTPSVIPSTGRHAAATNPYPSPSDPFADPDQTRIDPGGNR